MKYLLSIFLALVTPSALAGGISGGGGGVTNPHPSSPEAIFRSLSDHGAQAIVAWLNVQERAYLWDKERGNALPSYRSRLFGGPRNIFEVIRDTEIELRFHRPCRDNKGNPKDGSATASSRSVCLSPFSMAPKLNEWNVRQETLALLLHELSHLLGTDEMEAEALQRAALLDFHKIDFYLFNTQPEWVRENLASLIDRIEQTALVFDPALHAPYVISVHSDVADILENLDFGERSDFSMSRGLQQGESSAHLLRVDAIDLAACLEDPRAPSEQTKWCADSTDRAFGGKEIVTAADYLHGKSGTPYDAIVPGYKNVWIRRMRSTEEMRAAWRETLTFLRSIQAELKRYEEVSLSLSRK